MKEKLPIILTLEIAQHPEPNDHWCTITGVLSWEDIYTQRMDPAMCLKSEEDDLKDAIRFFAGEAFDVREVKEVHVPFTWERYP